MNLVAKLLGKHPAKDYFFMSYKSGSAGISCVAVRTKGGYKDLLNHTHIDAEQVEFRRLFVKYVKEVGPEELISTSKVRELAFSKFTDFHNDLAGFYKARSEENAKKEAETVLGISIQ